MPNAAVNNSLTLLNSYSDPLAKLFFTHLLEYLEKWEQADGLSTAKALGLFSDKSPLSLTTFFTRYRQLVSSLPPYAYASDTEYLLNANLIVYLENQQQAIIKAQALMDALKSYGTDYQQYHLFFDLNAAASDEDYLLLSNLLKINVSQQPNDHLLTPETEAALTETISPTTTAIIPNTTINSGVETAQTTDVISAEGPNVVPVMAFEGPSSTAMAVLPRYQTIWPFSDMQVELHYDQFNDTQVYNLRNTLLDARNRFDSSFPRYLSSSTGNIKARYWIFNSNDHYNNNGYLFYISTGNGGVTYSPGNDGFTSDLYVFQIDDRDAANGNGLKGDILNLAHETTHLFEAFYFGTQAFRALSVFFVEGLAQDIGYKEELPSFLIKYLTTSTKTLGQIFSIDTYGDSYAVYYDSWVGVHYWRLRSSFQERQAISQQAQQGDKNAVTRTFWDFAIREHTPFLNWVEYEKRTVPQGMLEGAKEPIQKHPGPPQVRVPLMPKIANITNQPTTTITALKQRKKRSETDSNFEMTPYPGHPQTRTAHTEHVEPITTTYPFPGKPQIRKYLLDKSNSTTSLVSFLLLSGETQKPREISRSISMVSNSASSNTPFIIQFFLTLFHYIYDRNLDKPVRKFLPFSENQILSERKINFPVRIYKQPPSLYEQFLIYGKKGWDSLFTGIQEQAPTLFAGISSGLLYGVLEMICQTLSDTCQSKHANFLMALFQIGLLLFMNNNILGTALIFASVSGINALSSGALHVSHYLKEKNYDLSSKAVQAVAHVGDHILVPLVFFRNPVFVTTHCLAKKATEKGIKRLTQSFLEHKPQMQMDRLSFK